MKIRDKFLISLPLYVAVLVLVPVVMAFSHLVDFNKTYMHEEHSELQVFYKQMVWGLKPYLEKGDFKMVKEYCADFDNNPEMSLRVFDENKTLIAESRPVDKSAELPGERKQFFIPVIKVMTYSGELDLKGRKYFLELTISEESVIKTLLEAQYNIVIFFIACFVFLLLCIIYVILKVQIPFNTLQKSVTKIAAGNLDTEIEIPESRILHELAGAVSIMAQKLKRQIVRLQQLEAYRKDFIANVSHEIKTPLTAITSAVELLETNDTNSQNLKCLKILDFQSKRLNNLVNDILCLAEIENSQSTVSQKFTLFDLNKLIQEIIKHLNINEPKINFVYNTTVEYLGNEKLIEHAITNLIVNAVKYSQSPQIDVLLTQNKDEVRIDVKDYGIGIAGEHLARIFERFYRVDKSRSRENGGTGLGLAIVKNIAILHDGYVNAESIEGQGSTFSMILPNKKSE